MDILIVFGVGHCPPIVVSVVEKEATLIKLCNLSLLSSNKSFQFIKKKSTIHFFFDETQINH